MTSIQLLHDANDKLYPLIIQSLSDQKSTRYNGKSEWSLKQLDDWRNVELPGIVTDRWKRGAETWITKDELVLLMDWKLAKGKFRPTLPKLIRQNEAEVVEQVTKSAFNTILQFVKGKAHLTKGDDLKYISTVKEATKKVSELRGVGPATGSLILSLLVGILKLAPPFLSDESFIYFVVEPSRSGTKIKYNLKEYTDEFLPVFLELVAENDESFVSLEKGAWAIKFYDLGKIDITADIDVPFKVDHDVFFKYIKAEVKQEEEREGKVEEDKKKEKKGEQFKRN